MHPEHPDEPTLWRYLDGECAADEAARLEAAAAADPALARRIEDLRAVRDEVREELFAGAPRLPEEFPDRVVEAARALPRGDVIDLAEARRFLKRALVAAALLGAIGLTYLAVEVLPDLFGLPTLQARPQPDPWLLGR